MYSFIYWMELHLTLGSSANNASANDASVDKGKGKGKVVEADDNMEEEEEEEEEEEDVSGDEEEEEEDEEVCFFFSSAFPSRKISINASLPLGGELPGNRPLCNYLWWSPHSWC
jgi:hypothetical protein